MDYGFRYVKKALNISIKEPLITSLFLTVTVIPLSRILPTPNSHIPAILLLFYFVIVVWYITVGTYGYLCQRSDDGPRLSIRSFINIANRYYMPAGKVLICLVLFEMLFISPFRLFGFSGLSATNLGKISEYITSTTIPHFFFVTATIYTFPSLFIEGTRNFEAIICGFGHLRFIIKNRASDFVGLFLLQIMGLAFSILRVTDDIYPNITLLILSNIGYTYVGLLSFLTAIMQVREFEVREEKIDESKQYTDRIETPTYLKRWFIFVLAFIGMATVFFWGMPREPIIDYSLLGIFLLIFATWAAILLIQIKKLG